MRRRDQDARSVPGPRRSGTIPRGELRRQLPPTDSSDWLILLVVGAIALAAVAAIAGVFDGPRAPAGATGSGSPPGTAAASAAAQASPPTALTPSVPASPTEPPTEPPTPGPTAPPTPSPTARPTPSPTARPTGRPTPTAQPRATATAGTASPRPTDAAGGLAILEPADGEVVSDRSIVIRGVAPPGAVITRDIPFWFDEHARADAAGRWSITVELVPGDNKLTFRVGDDIRTSRTVTVRFEPD